MNLNFSFPPTLPKGPFGIWLKRVAKFAALLILLFFAYRLVQWTTTPIKEIYRVGIDTSWYPLALYGKEHNTTLFTTDLLGAIARDQGLKIEILKVDHKRLMDLLESEQLDGVLTTRTPDRNLLGKYDFSEPYYRYGAVLVTGMDSSIASLQDLDNRRLGVKRSSSLLFRFPLTSQTHVTPYDNFLMALQALSERRVDAVLLDQLLFYVYFSPLYPNQFKVATLPLTEEGLRLATLKSKNAELIEKFNAGLQDLKKNGDYDRLLKAWDLYDPEKLTQ